MPATVVRSSLRRDRHPAAQRFDAIVRGAAFRSQVALRDDLEGERALLASDAHRDRRAGRRALERVERAEVDGAGDLRRHGDVHVDVDPRRHAGAARRRAELRRPARPPRVAEGRSGWRAPASPSTPAALHAAARPGAPSPPCGSESSDPAATSRLAASPTRSCCTPSCRARSMSRRSASAASTSRSRDARSSSISRRNPSRVGCSSVCSVSSGCPPAPRSPAVVRHRSGGVKRPARYRDGWQHPGVRQGTTVEPEGTTS